MIFQHKNFDHVLTIDKKRDCYPLQKKHRQCAAYRQDILSYAYESIWIHKYVYCIERQREKELCLYVYCIERPWYHNACDMLGNQKAMRHDEKWFWQRYAPCFSLILCCPNGLNVFPAAVFSSQWRIFFACKNLECVGRFPAFLLSSLSFFCNLVSTWQTVAIARVFLSPFFNTTR